VKHSSKVITPRSVMNRSIGQQWSLPQFCIHSKTREELVGSLLPEMSPGCYTPDLRSAS